MIPAMAVRVSAWFWQAAATLPDTIMTRSVIERGWFDQVTHVAGGILTLLLLLVVLLIFPAAWYVRNRLKQLTAVIDGLRHDVAPIVERTRGLMQNAEEVSGTVRRDVERLSETVQRFDRQLRDIGDIAVDRVRDVDALLGAVQDEAEDLFLSTASAARGIRAGMRALRRHRTRQDRRAELSEAQARARALAAEPDEEPEDGAPRDRAPRLRRRRQAT